MNTSPAMPDRSEKVLVCSPNWVGDCIMAMPAVQALAARAAAENRGAKITVLAKESLVPLWRLNPSAGELIVLREGPLGTLRTVRAVRARRFERACVLSHSMRAALIPFLARVPVRAGTRGQRRGRLLNRLVTADDAPGREHMSFEYLQVAGLEGGELERPRLVVPDETMIAMRSRLGLEDYAGSHPLAAVIPGAARGPSKRWPAERFAEVARRLAAEAGCRIVACGTSSEREFCEDVVAAVKQTVDDPAALNLAGETTLPELIAMLSLCRVAVANDSGGMHLAAAAGARVVAVFGVTDPAVTGPLGGGHKVVRPADPGAVSRTVSRSSPRARASLESIGANDVFEAAVEVLAEKVRIEDST